MGFLGRVSKEDRAQPGTTVVAGGTNIVGDLELSDDFHLDGTMQGTLFSECNVCIGQNGSFEGEIRARKIVVSGRFKGNLDAGRLEIVASGKVVGDIRVCELVIEPGGEFNGSSHIKKSDDEPRRLGHQAPESQVAENQARLCPDLESVTPEEQNKSCPAEDAEQRPTVTA